MCTNGCESYNPFDEMTFTNDRCFVCGKQLSHNATMEHVYPKWLQRDFNLWEQRLELLNGTCIRYRDMVIPCCVDCNNIMSERIEKPVKEAVAAGYDAVIRLDPQILFQWLNKISYGTLFKQLSLRMDRRDPASGTIYAQENLAKHRMQFLFLRSTIQEVDYVHQPWSILVFKINDDDAPAYWAYDNPIIKTFFMRLNDVGIIAHLMDNGCNQEFFLQTPTMAELLQKELHPIQFAEICAKFHYKSSLMNRLPFYMSVFDQEHNLQMIIAHEMGGILFDDWNQETYAHVLSFFWEPWKMDITSIYQPPDQVLSYIRNTDGTFNDLFS